MKLYGFLVLGVYCAHTLAYKTIIDVLSEDARFETLLGHLQRTRLIPHVNALKAATLFAPDNDAFAKYNDGDITADTLLYHLLPVGMLGEDFYHDQLLESLYIRPGYLGSDEAGQRIKITKEGNPRKGRGKVYINQAQIISKDIPVNNQTYIQVIDRVLQPPHTISKTIRQTYNDTYALLEKIGMHDLLNEGQPFTLFVPRDNILNQLATVEQQYLLSRYGKEDLGRLLKYMVVKGAVYAADFPNGKTLYETLSGESIVIAVDKDNHRTVNGIPVVKTDTIAANGVVHELESGMVPSNIVFDVRKYLYGFNATKFVTLMETYGLGHYLGADSHNFTVLVPSNDDLDDHDVPIHTMRSWLRYHLLPGCWTNDLLQDSMLMDTEYKASSLGGAPQKLPVFIETEKMKGKPTGKSIRFNHARVLGDGVMVGENMIYQLSDPVNLPSDILSTMVIDLDLSTFIAALYVSKVSDVIKNINGITLFVPTNDAFQELGLVAKYLVHPSAKDHLQSVLRYHAAEGLLYRQDLLSKVNEAPTLANATLRITPMENHEIIVGRPDRPATGIVRHTNVLVANGVVHKIDQVQIPSHVKISNRDLLVGIEATTMLQILDHANLTAMINDKNWIVLAPSDKAFAHLDLDALFADPYQLDRIARLHLIPQPWPNQWVQERDKTEYPTYLSDKDKLVIRDEGHRDLVIDVKDQSSDIRARVIAQGRSTFDGGVLLLDSVLIPVRRGFFGLPWGWSIVVVTGITLLSASIASLCGFVGYKIYNRRRLGYRAI
ncbi:FAS1 domain-containing protein [Radiomyces spectabilis]|uniref:FAS1 domain-containing protein n=1 Tax=Radiomyces spectabilis TaxID=64574 RepID=UPI0022207DAB|nr:FAS1 domain-containing protein [Radiomyces spectabilis]KAI8377850.1 FAS1 domain-containing protein [Radiomyces spectabilis]